MADMQQNVDIVDDEAQDLATVKDQTRRLKLVKNRFRRAKSSQKKEQARRQSDFAFEAGHQWTSEEIDALEEENRPVLTFNLIKSQVSLIMGSLEQNRVVFKAQPVNELEDQFLCDVHNDAADWCYETWDVEKAEDDAFENAVIGGVGYVAIDARQNPKRPLELMLEVESLDPREVYYDHDGEWVFWEKWYTKDNFKVRFPDHAENIDDILRGDFDGSVRNIFSDEDTDDVYKSMDLDEDYADDDYDTPMDWSYYDRNKSLVKVVHYEYKEACKRYYGWLDPNANPYVDQPTEFELEQLPEVKAEYEAATGMPFEWFEVADFKIKWVQFAGHTVLYDDDSPYPFDGFSIVPCVAYTDKSKDPPERYGLVRLLKDPQKEVNKRWSQTLNLINKQGAGIIAEVDAFVDIEEAKDNWNDPNRITFVTKGALAQGKIQDRPVPQFPQATMAMQEHSSQIMKQIGVNSDLLGMSQDREEPGVVVRMRQVQGMLILKPLFKGLYKMLKEVRKRIHAIIAKHMPTHQIARIIGSNEKYIIQDGIVQSKETGMVANLQDIKFLDYDLRVEEAPGNMSKLVYELQTIMEMQKAGLPVDPHVLIEKLDLPADEKQRWFKFIDQTGQKQEQLQQLQIQLEQGKLQIEAAKNEIEKMKVMADMQLKQANSQIKGAELQLKGQEAQVKMQDAQMRMAADAMKMRGEQAKLAIEAQSAQQKLMADIIGMKQERALRAAQFQTDAVMKRLDQEQEQFNKLAQLKIDMEELDRKKTKDKYDLLVDMLKLEDADQALVAEMIQAIIKAKTTEMAAKQRPQAHWRQDGT